MTDYDAHDEISDLQKSISMLEEEIETWKSLYFSAENAAKQNKEEVERLRDAVNIGVAMRAAQKAYFANRTQGNLVASKQMETEFDKAARAALAEQEPK